MADEFFDFTDLVSAFANDKPLTYKAPTGGTEYNPDGTQVKKPTEEIEFIGVLAPFGNRQLLYSLNGAYTSDDRQLFTDADLQINTIVVGEHGSYKIDRQLDYNEWTATRIYYCRKVKANG